MIPHKKFDCPLIVIQFSKAVGLIILLFGSLIQYSFGQSYYVGLTPDAPGSYRRTAHSLSGIPNSDKPMATKMLDATVDVVKYVYPSPVGAEIGPYGGVFQNFQGVSEFKNGPYVTHMTIPFFELLRTRTGAIEAGGEYGSNIDIWMNSVHYILQGNQVDYGNRRVYRSPYPGIPVSGFPKYNNMILVLPPGKPLPWRPATKQEYLENFIEGLKANLPGRSSTEAEKQLIPDAEQLLASMSNEEKKQIAYLLKNKYSSVKQGHSEFKTRSYGLKWAGFQDPSDTTAEQLVIIDENFYDKNLSRTSYQVIVIDRRYPRASISAAAPTPEAKKNAQRITDRINSIVRHKEFLPGLLRLTGKQGFDYVSGKPQTQQQQKTIVVKKPTIKNIDRILDSLMRNYKFNLPIGPVPSSPPVAASPGLKLPTPNQKKLSLAGRRLNTKQELLQYLDTLDKKISAALAGTTVKDFGDHVTATKAAYGFWIFNHPREALLAAIQAAKKQPESNTTLNNLAATLSLCGIDYLAVPIYHVCISKEHGNSTLYNNLGQSYLALGDHQKAEQYLNHAISTSPYHPHANNSLGFLYQTRGSKDQAFKCYENSIRSSFTLAGFNGLKALRKDSAKKLMNYIRHRYKQPDYINFNKYPAPLQCTKHDQTLLRIAQHKEYRKQIDFQKRKFSKLKDLQEPIAQKANLEYFSGKRKQTIRPFLPFAGAMVTSIHLEFYDKLIKLEKDLKELERRSLRLKIEFDTLMKGVEDAFEPRADKIGEGNPDPTFDEDYCNARNAVVDAYLPQFAEVNEEKYKKIVHVYKEYLNDYLYWVRFSSFTPEQYQLEFYEIVLKMYWVLERVQLTTLNGWCDPDPEGKPKNDSLTISEADCPLPIGVEIPFVVGKIQFDCESWGLEIGEGIVFNLDHLAGGATTIAIGPGESFYSTPKVGGPLNFAPGIDFGIKGQVFVTFDANTLIDWGLLFESEFDIKGLGKPLELKQNVTLAVNKGFTVDGVLTASIDKYFEVPPEKQVNKNIRIYKPQ